MARILCETWQMNKALWSIGLNGGEVPKYRQIYAVYRGEENLGDGHGQEELAKKFNIRKKTLYAMGSEAILKRNKGNRLIVIKLDKEEV